MSHPLPDPRRWPRAMRVPDVAALGAALGAALFAAASALAQQPAAATAPASAKPAQRAPQGAIEGVINRVTDGDSLWLQPAGRAPIEVRLRDIDAPEICQDYGPDAKKALEQFALGKTARLISHGKDAHGRTIGTVTIDGQSVSKWMVGEGHAWSTRFRSDRGPLLKEERMATALRRGIHATSEPKKPWDFRKQHGPCK
ncbi:MAG: thermonuclease family protein [Rubrivivax sp.]|nr:thermonuclease family protein [Rubrivivax sp.]